MRRIADERGIIVSWLVKLLLGFAVFAVVAYDAGSIMVNFFTLDQAAKDIADEIQVDGIADARFNRMNALEERGKELAGQVGARLTALEVSEKGDVHVQLKRRASTLLVGRISAIKEWARATADATVRDTL